MLPLRIALEFSYVTRIFFLFFFLFYDKKLSNRLHLKSICMPFIWLKKNNLFLLWISCKNIKWWIVQLTTAKFGETIPKRIFLFPRQKKSERERDETAMRLKRISMHKWKNVWFVTVTTRLCMWWQIHWNKKKKKWANEMQMN